jgi:VanZ family protein
MTFSRQTLFYWLAIGWTVAIFVACSWPSNAIHNDLSNNDKWGHALMFLIFAVLWVWSGRKPGFVLLVGIAYGMLTEIWQGVTPFGRTFDWYDGLADAVGVVLGVGLVVAVSTYQRTANRKQ